MNDQPNDRRRRAILVTLPLVLIALVWAPNCRKLVREPSLIRLIDLLERKGIVDSPLLNYVSNSKGLARDCPNLADLADKYPLLDAGTGPNPLLLKKKLRVGPIEDNALLAVPKSVYRFRVRIPQNSSLEFFFGIYWGKDPARKQGGSREADFSVRLRGRKANDLLFQKQLTLTAARTMIIKRKKIDLGRLAGQEVDLEFSTRGRVDTLAFWFNPIIFRAETKAPNIILVSLDTLRADHLACYGYGRATSPVMDKLASESVLFKNTYASSPWTLPSHVSLVTGLEEVNHGVYHPADKMDPNLPTLADYLRQSGYATSAFTGGGFVNGIYGLSKGFDSFRIVGRIISPTPAEQLARSVLFWLEGNREKKFFLFLHTYQIHQPYLTPPPYNKMFLDPDADLDHVDLSALRLNHENRFQPPTDARRRNYIGLYDAEIRYTDNILIGALVRELKTLGLYDRTMLIITSDHGEEFYEHKAWAHGHALYDETIKIPLLIKFPGSRNGGTRVERIARLTDIMPTILEEMGVDYPRKGLDGRSLLELVGDKGDRGPERIVRCELGARIARDRVPRKRAVCREGFKIIANDPYTPDELAFFLVPPPNQDKLEIYNLTADPGETKNLASSRPDLARSLFEFLEENLKPTRGTIVRRSEPTEEIREELKALGYIR